MSEIDEFSTEVKLHKVLRFKPKKPEPILNWPEVTKEGLPKRSYANARAAINALGLSLSYDDFHDRLLIKGPQAWASGELSDAAEGFLRQAILDEFEFDPGKDAIADAAKQLCMEGRFHPIIQYLDSAQWDGTPRVGNWLSTYLGAEQSDLHSAMGRLTLIAAVRRIRQPGCKFDHILTLEGPEGSMKSTAIATLAGADNFSDQAILSSSEKEQQELVRGVWLYEVAELNGMRKAEVGKIKAFASRTTDRARPAYGRRRVDVPRSCVFIGTTNEDSYLQSQTGNRRFWPVQTGFIDIPALKADRDQLWAEAAAMEAQGESLMLPQELWAAAAEAQERRRTHDVFEDVLETVKGTIFTISGEEIERITTTEVLAYIKLHLGNIPQGGAQSIGPAMRRHGWEGPKMLKPPGARGYSRRKVQENTATPATPQLLA